VKVAYLAENFGRVDRAWTQSADRLMHHTGHNVGNMAFWYAAKMLVEADCHLVGRSTRARDVPADVQAFIIPAANFLNKDADLSQLAELVRELDRPCLVFGLGAQSEQENALPALKPGTLDFLKEVSKRTPTIGIRGEFTRNLCNTLGVENTTVLGCPTSASGCRRRSMRWARKAPSPSMPPASRAWSPASRRSWCASRSSTRARPISSSVRWS
jgi:hypothetical protein